MKTKKKLLITTACLSGIVAAVVLATLLLQKGQSGIVWHDFGQSNLSGGKPRYWLEMANERDFGYRTGQLMPLRLWLKVPAGTQVDLESLALVLTVKAEDAAKEPDAARENDTIKKELAAAAAAKSGSPASMAPADPAAAVETGTATDPARQQAPGIVQDAAKQPEAADPGAAAFAPDLKVVRRLSLSKPGDGGEVYYMVDLDLQAVDYLPKWSIAVKLNYRTAGDGRLQALTTDALRVSVLKTYDGVKSRHAKDPHLDFLQGNHMMVTLGLLAAGATGMVSGARSLWRSHKAKAPGRQALPVAGALHDPFQAVGSAWRDISCGKHSHEAFDALALAVRACFKIDPCKSVADLHCRGSSLDGNLAVVLEVCRDACWSNKPVSDAQIERLAQAVAAVSPDAGLKAGAPKVELSSEGGVSPQRL